MEVRQGQRVFRWPGQGRRIYVFDKDGRALGAVDMPPAPGHKLTLDHVHDAIDEYLAGLTRSQPIG